LGQIITLLITSVIAYFGLVYVKEYRWTELKPGEMTELEPSSEEEKKEEEEEKEKEETTKIESKSNSTQPLTTTVTATESKTPTPQSKTPEVKTEPSIGLIGNYKLDHATTAKWFSAPNHPNLEKKTKESLAQQPDVNLEFTGAEYKIDTKGIHTVVPNKPLEQSKQFIKIKLPLDGMTELNTYYLQWDKAGFWASHYKNFPNVTKPILLRKRFQIVKENQPVSKVALKTDGQE